MSVISTKLLHGMDLLLHILQNINAVVNCLWEALDNLKCSVVIAVLRDAPDFEHLPICTFSQNSAHLKLLYDVGFTGSNGVVDFRDACVHSNPKIVPYKP